MGKSGSTSVRPAASRRLWLRSILGAVLAAGLVAGQAPAAQDPGKVPTTTTLTASPNPALQGQQVTLTAVVTDPTAAPACGGSVVFSGTTGGNVSSGLTPVPNTDDMATASIVVPEDGSLGIGPNSIGATFVPLSTQACAASSAPPISVDILTPSTTSVTATPDPQVEGQPVTITATVEMGAFGAPCTGTVAFAATDSSGNATNLGNGSLSTNPGGTPGVPPSSSAQISTSALSAGTYAVAAGYSGDDYCAASATATGATEVISPPPPIMNALVASILPDSRSVGPGIAATVFATMLNSSASSLTACGPALPANAPAGLVLAFQTTDPTTNSLTGQPNQPADMAPAGSAGSALTFVLSFTGPAGLTSLAQPVVFACSNAEAAPVLPGVDTVDLVFATSVIPDIIALAATSTLGVVEVPYSQGAPGAFAVATANVGAAAPLTVSADTGAATLPLTITLCQSNPATAACLAPPSASVTTSFAAGGTPTFSIFVSASGQVPFAPGTSRIFVRFGDAAGVSHGSTSVAVETQ